MHIPDSAKRGAAARHHACLLPAGPLRWSDVLASVRRIEEEGWDVLLCTAATGGFEPLTLLAGLVPRTRQLGLVAQIDPAETPPYTAARRLAALDHASRGRIGWRLPDAFDAARAQDYADTVVALWDSWGEGLHRIDRAQGRYIDVAGIRPANHEGPFYASAGPLDVPRPPQGHPVFYATTPGPHVDVLLGSVAFDAPAPAKADRAPQTFQTLRARLGLAVPGSHRHVQR